MLYICSVNLRKSVNLAKRDGDFWQSSILSDRSCFSNFTGSMDLTSLSCVVLLSSSPDIINWTSSSSCTSTHIHLLQHLNCHSDISLSYEQPLPLCLMTHEFFIAGSRKSKELSLIGNCYRFYCVLAARWYLK